MHRRRLRRQPSPIQYAKPDTINENEVRDLATPIPKPDNWNSLQFHQKISIYKHFLGAEIALFVDKLSAKQIASSFGVKGAPLVRILKDVDDITEQDLKDGWILKATHGCRWNIWLHPALTLSTIKQQLKEWNKPYRPDSEPHYKHITPRFYIEERIVDKCFGTSNSLSYQIRCVFGTVIPVIRVWYHDAGNTYDLEWNELESPQIPYKIPKPAHLNKIVEFASAMSKSIEFVRIDFYVDVHDDVYFSEYTFTPRGGLSTGLHSLEDVASKYWV
jgi:hypothetical protein